MTRDMAISSFRSVCALAGTLAFSLGMWSCAAPTTATDGGVVHPELGTFDRQPGVSYFCDLPLPDLPLAGLPAGFCVRQFASGIAAGRVMAWASNGDLFVA